MPRNTAGSTRVSLTPQKKRSLSFEDHFGHAEPAVPTNQTCLAHMQKAMLDESLLSDRMAVGLRNSAEAVCNTKMAGKMCSGLEYV